MQITLDIVDSMSGTVLPGATISINGSAVGQTDVNGVYVIENANESDQITVSFVGYSPYSLNAGVLESSAQVQLARSGDTLPSVTVTPSPASPNYLPWLVAGGVALVLWPKKRKSVGASKKNKNLLIGAGFLGVGAVYLMTRPSTPAVNSSGTLLTTQQMVANKAASTNPFASLLSSISPSLSNLFGSSTPAPGTPGSFTPVSVDTSNATSSDDISPSFDYDTVSPGAASSLDFSSAPGMSGIGDVSTYLPYIIGAGALALVLSGSKKKVGSTDFSKYILPVGIVVGGYLILTNTGLFGSNANSGNNASIDTSTSQSVQASLNAAQASGDQATITSAQASGIAAAIYNAGIDPVNMDAIQSSLMQVKTLTDLLLVIQAFGTKSASGSTWDSCSLLGINCQSYNLSAWVTLNCDASHLSAINNYFSSQGINYSF